MTARPRKWFKNTVTVVVYTAERPLSTTDENENDLDDLSTQIISMGGDAYDDDSSITISSYEVLASEVVESIRANGHTPSNWGLRHNGTDDSSESEDEEEE